MLLSGYNTRVMMNDPYYSIKAAIERANESGIRIHVIGCSGLDSGRSEFQRIAGGTSGTYADLTYNQVVTDPNGKRRSVVYWGGEYYEAEEELSKDDWGRGGSALVKEGKVRRASGAMRSRAAVPGAATRNNLDDMVLDSVKKEAKKKGVSY